MNHLWNVTGARLLSRSGRQLFTIDKFRDTGRPLLSVLADPDSIFFRGLAKFQHRTLYANLINDKSAVFYTCGISRFDPFYPSPDEVKVNFVPGYEPVIVEPSNPVSPLPQRDAITPGFRSKYLSPVGSTLLKIPIFCLYIVLIPLGLLFFLANAGIMTLFSSRRIRLHETGKGGVGIHNYRGQHLIEGVQNAVADVFEGLNETQDPDYLTDAPGSGSEEEITFSSGTAPNGAAPVKRKYTRPQIAVTEAEKQSSASAPLLEANEQLPTPPSEQPSSRLAPPRRGHSRQKSKHQVGQMTFPTLALAPHQFVMLDALDTLNFRKFPVWIHKSPHSHAAIIYRMPKKGMEEGEVVVRHWLETPDLFVV
jgi:Putative serine esterase (DUF676)